MLVIKGTTNPQRNRVEEFRNLARRRASGDLLAPPALLGPVERRRYVRETLREDHQFRLENRPEGAQAKFDKLAKTPWNFFRGTSLLFYRDIAGFDADLPLVLVTGDAHPENFGVMPNEDGAPFFGLNDFDEAGFAPYTWELRRASVGFYLSARVNGHGKKRARKIVKALIGGYVDALLEFARNDRETTHEFRIDNSPPMIRELLKDARTSRKDFLADMIDLEKGRFRSTKEIVPHTKHLKQFQAAIDEYRKSSDVPKTERTGHFKVKDVAIKKGSGTASLGLDRYFVLLDGPTNSHADDVMLELKQTRPSAMRGLVGLDDGDSRGSNSSNGGQGRKKRARSGAGNAEKESESERIVNSQKIHAVGGDPYFGRTTLDGRDFIVKERSPCKEAVDVEDLDFSEFREYSAICGKTMAIAHARCDDDAEERILESVNRALLIDDMVKFAEDATRRLRADFKAFRKDHRLGAFEFNTDESS